MAYVYHHVSNLSRVAILAIGIFMVVTSVNNASATSISLSPTMGSVGSTITISGSGFAPSATVTLKFNGVAVDTNTSLLQQVLQETFQQG